jgi:hypothetical protein
VRDDAGDPDSRGGLGAFHVEDAQDPLGGQLLAQ